MDLSLLHFDIKTLSFQIIFCKQYNTKVLNGLKETGGIAHIHTLIIISFIKLFFFRIQKYIFFYYGYLGILEILSGNIWRRARLVEEDQEVLVWSHHQIGRTDYWGRDLVYPANTTYIQRQVIDVKLERDNLYVCLANFQLIPQIIELGVYIDLSNSSVWSGSGSVISGSG